jgi:hypothetical protein
MCEEGNIRSTVLELKLSNVLSSQIKGRKLLMFIS